MTPRVVAIGLALHLGLWLAAQLPVTLGWMPQARLTSWGFRTTASCLALAVALLLNLEVAKEYRHAPWLQVAWLGLAANAGLSVFRMIFESPLLDLIHPGYSLGPLLGLLQHLAIVPANICLLIGVVAMCWAYHRVGLGFEIERRDCVMMAGIAAVLIALLTFREGLTQAQSPYLPSRYLQQSGLILLALATAVSVVLHRMTIQMGGGQLATALNLLTLYALARSVLVLLGALNRALPPEFLVLRSYFFDLAWQAVVWLPALTGAYRVQMTVTAARELEQLEQRRGAGEAALVS